MEEKKVSAEQIDALFEFMRSKRVRFYDLQIELVDHFASAIEDLWREDPKLSFEMAIHKVYGKFPITGFYQVIEQQTQAIQKAAWRWVWQQWVSYFRWPKVLLSLAIFGMIRLGFYLPFTPPLLMYFICLLLLTGAYWLLYGSRKRVHSKDKRFLKLEATRDVIHNFMNCINAGLYIIIFSQLTTVPDWAAWVLSFLFTYLSFLIYILFYELPKRAEEELRRHFPAYAS